jgi:hypothetical protein
MRVNTTGVGIGTTSPGYELDVNGDINVASGQRYRIGGTSMMVGNTTYNNYFFGNAGNLTMTGGYNTASGYYALHANTTGSQNTATGSWAFYHCCPD